MSEEKKTEKAEDVAGALKKVQKALDGLPTDAEKLRVLRAAAILLGAEIVPQ